jgi:hypothetical protein
MEVAPRVAFALSALLLCARPRAFQPLVNARGLGEKREAAKASYCVVCQATPRARKNVAHKNAIAKENPQNQLDLRSLSRQRHPEGCLPARRIRGGNFKVISPHAALRMRARDLD